VRFHTIEHDAGTVTSSSCILYHATSCGNKGKNDSLEYGVFLQVTVHI